MINLGVIIHFLLLCIGLSYLQVFVMSSNECVPSNEKKFDWKEKESIGLDEGRYPGEWYIINCSLPDNMINVSLVWKKNDQSQKKIVPDQHKVKEFNQVFNITNLKFSDSGRYTCKACNRSDKERGILTIVSDGKAYQRPKILNEPKSNVSYGSDLEMDCQVTGWYKMNWYKDDAIVYEKGRNSKVYVSDLEKTIAGIHITKKRLTIRRFTEYEDGLYTCIAERPAVQWKAKYEVYLTVVKDGISSLKPRIKKTPKFEKAGDTITMACESNGSVLMVWRKQGRNGTLPSQDVSLQQRVFNVTKKISIIQNFTKQDEGIYECFVKVKNRPWSIAETITITMKVKPTIIKGNANEVITFKVEGKEIKCELSTKAVPRANISWERCICDSNCSECNKWFKLPDTSSTIERNNAMLSTLTIQKLTSERVIYRCTAENGVGPDNREWEVVKDYQGKENDNRLYIIIISCIAILMLIFLLLAAVVLYRRKKLYGGFYIFTVPPLVDYIGQLDEEKSLLEQSSKLPYISQWEFPRERVHLDKDIGKGAFGRVCLAEVIGISAFHPRKILEEKSKQNRFSVFRNRKRNSYLYCTFSSKAAVKMLNDNWNDSNLSDLLTELKLLIHIGEHNNIVNILGACTKGDRGDTWIIMEHCEYGNLSQFLNARRTIFKNEWLAFSEDQNMSLSHSDLAAIALQVVFGMRFLVSRKCIHRDLAARNVLIGHDFVPKIADFGLARDVYKDEQYIKKNSGLLPIKWMSIEAIEDLIFSEKSDVWSFGILLWEIFAMGGSPYIGIPASEIYTYLFEGKRMQPPALCPSEIYSVMFDCWKHKPEERPDFKTVEENLSKILMDKDRPWILAFEQDEPEVLPEKYSMHIGDKSNKFRYKNPP